jgi:hypothetical protein
MINAMELLKTFSDPNYKCKYGYAKATGTCVKCGKSAKLFKNSSARLEYAVSALCQNCQEKYLDKDALH